MTLSAHDWQGGLAHDRLLLLACRACGTRWLPWMPTCPACGADDSETIEASGRGSVYSWATMRHPASDPALPRTIAAVTLDEGPILFARLHGPDGTAHAGLLVSAVFSDAEAGRVVEFEPAVSADVP